MSDAGGTSSAKNAMKTRQNVEVDTDEDSLDSADEDETIARIKRAHFAQAAAMSARRRSAPRPRPMSQKRKMEAVKTFHDFTKKLKKDTGITIRGLVGNSILELSDFSSEESEDSSDGLSEEEFVVNPSAVQELNEENDSYIDPETGDIVETKKNLVTSQEYPSDQSPSLELEGQESEEPKTLSISDIINETDLDLPKNVEIAEVEESEKTADELLDIKQEENSQDFDITEKLKEMGEISVKPVAKKEDEEESTMDNAKKPETEDEKKAGNTNALNVRRNIREVMDEKNLDASTLAAQRQESERLARVQEQQRIIREVQKQIAVNRQNKIHQKTLSLLQGGSSILKKGNAGQKLNLPNTVLVKLPSGEMKKTTMKQGQVEVTKIPKPTPSSSAQKSIKSEHKTERKEVVEIVDSSSGEESSSSSSDSDDCIMLSDSEVPPSPEADEDPTNSGLHVNDSYNIPDERGRVLINIGHPENEEDIFLAPQIARVIKPHQIGGVRFLFDNIIESVDRFSTSTGFGCILAHSMGLGKTLQIVCFCDIFLRHTTSKTVLCIMPINTLQNWVAEFNMWIPIDATNSPLGAHGEVRPRSFPIYVLNDSHKTLQMRAKVVKDWSTTGGVLMIGYELFRLLSMKKDKKPRKKRKADAKHDADKEDKKSDKPDGANDDTQGSDAKPTEELKDKEDGSEISIKVEDIKEEKKEDAPTDEEKKLLDEMYEALVKPGPDLVICDEGHRIKNSHSNISYALKQMRTRRRVVLTGYPLQNNLLEYWCMVDFVRPNYLGSKTEFCNMFERPIQNGQCIDSTPQDIRLMRYRAHVLHSLLVGFVQRRSHAVLQSTLPQKEEFVLLVRMTPLQRQLYDRFMNEVVRSTSVPNPLKAFAICCKIWNHPDVLYNFLKKRSEVNAAIEEDLDLEELGGVTKAGRAKNSRGPPGKRGAKPRGSSKKPAATIPPNTTAPVGPTRQESFGNQPYPSNGPYGPQQNTYRPDQASGSFPSYNYQNQPGYYPPNQGYNQNYGNNYYPQQQPPYGNNYPNQYPPNPSEPGYNPNYWNNSNANYYGNQGYYNNPQYQNGQPPADFNNQQQYPPNYNPPNDPRYIEPAAPPYSNNQEGFLDQQRAPYQGPYPNQPGYPEYNANASADSTYPNNQPPPYSSNQPTQYPNNQPPYPNNTQTPFPNNASTQGYSNRPYQTPFQPNTSFDPSTPGPYSQYENQPANYPNYGSQTTTNPAIKTETYETAETKPDITASPNTTPFENPAFNNYSQPNAPSYPNQPETNSNGNYPCEYPFPSHIETKQPLGSSSSGSPVPTWPLTELKTEVDRLKAEEKMEIKSESDGEVKIEDLDTKKIVKDESKKEKIEPLLQNLTLDAKEPSKKKKDPKGDSKKSDGSESEEEASKKNKPKGRAGRKPDKTKTKGKAKPKGRKDRKTSKDKNNDDSESEESEKEEKLNREEELALVKKAEEMTYDWAAELLKDYIPGIIENSAKMEIFFYILTESIKLGDRLLLFSQSLFTLNLIENFLEKNYIPGTNCLWQRNTNYYRLDGSTHALEREKLINEFNANPNVYLFLVSTRAGSLGINLVGANRVIVFDASWNPCHDTQAVCRVYRYGQKKPCFVYRFVMDWCLEKKIYDRQINKQGMSDRVVDECNPDAVLSMKEITNLCFDNDEQESEPKDLSEHKDRYLDVIMQGIINLHGRKLSKEPFQHESLLVDRKEKKLSSAEKRLAQRGYELEKKAALAPKPTLAYRTVRTADGGVVTRPVASVRPMQHGARWIPADVWRRQGMTAQEMTLPLDVVIPTNSAEKTNIVLKAGQRVMVLKSPKGIYMQLESGKIIAIKTSFKGLGGQKPGDNKESVVGKKILGSRPTSTNIPGSLKNNSAITITSKGIQRPGMQRVITRPQLLQNRVARPLQPGQKLSDIRSRLNDMKAYATMKNKMQLQHHAKLIRPNLPGSVSITKIPKEKKQISSSNVNTDNKTGTESDNDTQVLDSDEEEQPKSNISSKNDLTTNVKEDSDTTRSPTNTISRKVSIKNDRINEPLVLTTDEKLPSEEVLDSNTMQDKAARLKNNENGTEKELGQIPDNVEKRINLLKNYRHQRPGVRPSVESSLSRLEKTASSLNKEGFPDFRRNLDDITQSYSPIGEEKPAAKSRRKKPPNKVDLSESQSERLGASGSGMSHSVSSLLSSPQKPLGVVPVAPIEQLPVPPLTAMSLESPVPHQEPIDHSHNKPLGLPPEMNPQGPSANLMAGPGQPYPGPNPAEGAYGQYTGYGMGYGGYPNASYYGAYGSGAYPYPHPHPPYAAAPASASGPPYTPTPAPASAPAPFQPGHPQW